MALDSKPDSPTMSLKASDSASSPKTMVIACAALTKELRSVLAPFGDAIHVEYLPAPLHNRPERIPDAIVGVLDAKAHLFERVVVAYGDCGTGGLLDAVLMERGISRLPGAHCYEFFAGTEVFGPLAEEELGTFFLTDYLTKHFDALIISGLGIDRHPELRDMYFGNYVRVVLLSQSEDPVVVQLARAAAERIGLAFAHRPTGLEPFRQYLTDLL
jgi:Protein of unknown function (DUF1638)